jgi:hypothetical protein
VAKEQVRQLMVQAWQVFWIIVYPSEQAEQLEELIGTVQLTQEGSHSRQPTPGAATSELRQGREQLVRE